MAYQFHYTPTGTGVISGKEVLEQTEDAINDLSGQISGDVQTAIDTANNALNTANTASADAQNAINTANTAYTAATNAQNTANAAQNTASSALTAAQNAQNDVNALGNRVTTAEGNITQNTNAITGLTTRMGTAEGNIGNLQTAVSTAQATANSAQQTATTARQQAYVVRYASVAVSDNSTVPYTDLNNVDNVKINDLLLDINGKFYQITSVDTSNETVSVTTPLTQLAVDSGVVHKSGDETVGGIKTFSDIPVFGTFDGIRFRCGHNSSAYVTFRSSNQANPGSIILSANNGNVDTTIHLVEKTLIPYVTNDIDLGTTSRKWKSFNGINPGALSLPSNSYVNVDTTNWDVAGGSNVYTPPANGWLHIRVTGATELMVRWTGWRFGDRRVSATATDLSVTIPVVAGVTVDVVTVASSFDSKCQFFPCQGNV